MLRRSERCSGQSIVLDKIRILTDAFHRNNGPRGSKKSRVYILNKLYGIFYKDFYQIRHEIHNTNNKKEDFFIVFMKTVEIRGNVILDELSYQSNQCLKSITLKLTISKTMNKIKNYIEMYNMEKTNAFVLLASKIGVDVITNINSYL